MKAVRVNQNSEVAVQRNHDNEVRGSEESCGSLWVCNNKRRPSHVILGFHCATVQKLDQIDSLLFVKSFYDNIQKNSPCRHPCAVHSWGHVCCDSHSVL